MKTTFTTVEYVRSHWQQPRGHGSWAFAVVADFKSGGEDRMV